MRFQMVSIGLLSLRVLLRLLQGLHQGRTIFSLSSPSLKLSNPKLGNLATSFPNLRG